MRCNNCNREIPDGSEFCSYCGSKQEETFFCYKCGHKLPPDSEFCQYCGTEQSSRTIQKKESSQPVAKKKKSYKPLIIIAIAAIFIAVAAVIVFVVIKPFDKRAMEDSLVKDGKTTTEEPTTSKDEDPFDSMSIEDKVAQSQDVSLSSFRQNFANLTKQNVHLSGYVIDTKEWQDKSTITIAEAMQWPYETTEMSEYFGTSGVQPIEEWMQQRDAWETVPKTPAVSCRLNDDGVAKGTPKEGDIVDVYCIVTQGTIKAFPYYITVR